MDFESIKAFLENPITKLTVLGGSYGLSTGTIVYIMMTKVFNKSEYSDKELLRWGLNYTALWTIFNTVMGFPVLNSLVSDPGFYAGFVGSYVTLETILNKINPQ